jgi:hypothetical protein
MVKIDSYVFRRLINIFVLFCLLPTAYSCSAHQQTETTANQATSASRSDQRTNENGNQAGGVMGTTSQAIGTVVLSPFRMMGQVLGVPPIGAFRHLANPRPI